MKITTSTGFTCEIEKESLTNMEFIESIAEVDNGNPFALLKTCELLLGKEQKKSLYEHHRLENGIVPAENITSEIKEIFNLLGEQSKN